MLADAAVLIVRWAGDDRNRRTERNAQVASQQERCESRGDFRTMLTDYLRRPSFSISAR
jgi:hypothetical protein